MVSMESGRISKINLQDETMVSIGGSLQDLVGVVDPLETTCRHWLTHGPPVYIVRIKILNKTRRLFVVVIFHLLVFGSGMPVGHHGDAPSETFLDEEIHVWFSEKFERDILFCLFLL